MNTVSVTARVVRWMTIGAVGNKKVGNKLTKKGIPCLDGSDGSHRHSRDEYRIILKEGELFGRYSNVRGN